MGERVGRGRVIRVKEEGEKRIKRKYGEEGLRSKKGKNKKEKKKEMRVERVGVRRGGLKVRELGVKEREGRGGKGRERR
jgi:hypothetical protein